jgi:tRNA pseudouridine55 synthase
LDGVLLLDKPAGLSSNQCLGVVKRLFSAQKAGHTGTLDPFATGLLPVALGEATKFSQGLLDADKSYLATMLLGVTTRTGDTEGEVIREAAVDTDDARIMAAMAGFRGEISQVPPMYSALKRDGRPLYEYARAGIDLDREARRIKIHSLDLVSVDGAQVVFRVRCSKGTYVRTLAEDIGNALGCGAHLTALRREAAGSLDLRGAHTIADLERMPPEKRDQALRPVDALIMNLPQIRLADAEAARLRLGQRIALAGLEVATEYPQGPIRAYGEGDDFIGLVEAREGAMRPLRLVVAGA